MTDVLPHNFAVAAQRVGESVQRVAGKAIDTADSGRLQGRNDVVGNCWHGYVPARRASCFCSSCCTWRAGTGFPAAACRAAATPAAWPVASAVPMTLNEPPAYLSPSAARPAAYRLGVSTLISVRSGMS